MTWRRISDGALTVGAVLGALCLLGALAAVVLDVRPLVFRSGSMAPAIGTGDLAFARSVPASELEIGDVVSVTTDEGVRITHRVVAAAPAGDGVALTLKGDANPVVDEAPYVVETADRVFFDIPKAGYLISWGSSPVGLFVGGILCAGLLYLVLRPGTRGDRARTVGRHQAVHGLAVVVLAAGQGRPERWRTSPTPARRQAGCSLPTGCPFPPTSGAELSVR